MSIFSAYKTAAFLSGLLLLVFLFLIRPFDMLFIAIFAVVPGFWALLVIIQMGIEFVLEAGDDPW